MVVIRATIDQHLQPVVVGARPGDPDLVPTKTLLLQNLLEAVGLKNTVNSLNAIKIAIAIGGEANRDILKEFTGSIESVVEVKNLEALKKIIRGES